MNISTVGVSVIFLPNGTIASELPIFEPGVMVETLPLRTSLTPAIVIGPAFDLLVNVLALFLLVAAMGFNLARRSKSRLE